MYVDEKSKEKIGNEIAMTNGLKSDNIHAQHSLEMVYEIHEAAKTIQMTKQIKQNKIQLAVMRCWTE